VADHDVATMPTDRQGGTDDTLAYPISPDYVKSWTFIFTCQVRGAGRSAEGRSVTSGTNGPTVSAYGSSGAKPGTWNVQRPGDVAAPGCPVTHVRCSR
jgi:hypothetical protein